MKNKIWQELKSLSMVELETKLQETKDVLFRLEFKHASTPLKNPLEIRTTRRLIARLNTLIKNAGIGK